MCIPHVDERLTPPRLIGFRESQNLGSRSTAVLQSIRQWFDVVKSALVANTNKYNRHRLLIVYYPRDNVEPRRLKEVDQE